jgi:hypothetical protein
MCDFGRSGIDALLRALTELVLNRELGPRIRRLF